MSLVTAVDRVLEDAASEGAGQGKFVTTKYLHVKYLSGYALRIGTSMPSIVYIIRCST